MSAIKNLLLLLALLCGFHLSPLCEAVVCYVKPTEPHNVICPGDPCYTLDEYVSNSSLSGYFASNTIFKFLNGSHNLSHNLTVSDVHNLTLRAYTEGGSVAICSEVTTTLRFELVHDVVMKGLTLQTLAIEFENCSNVTLNKLVSVNSTTSAITLNSTSGLVSISEYAASDSHGKYGVTMEWTAIEFPHSPYSQVLLHALNLTGFKYGVHMFGYTPGEIVLKNSTFGYTIQGMTVRPTRSNVSFVCENTIFHDNKMGLVFAQYYYHYFHKAVVNTVFLHNVSCIANAGAIFIEDVHNATINYCSFNASSAGAIRAIDSVLFFTGNVTFINNSSPIGGAISLFKDGFIGIPEPNNTYILFENNTAQDVGGAIFFSNTDYAVTWLYCRIYVPQPIISAKIVLNFSNNTAQNGGNAIYGAYLESCFVPTLGHRRNISDLILNITFFSPSLDKSHSVISSNAKGLCFCDKDNELGDCTPPSLFVYPGQVFEISIAVYGDLHGLITYPLQVDIEPGELGNSLQQTQYTSAKHCTKHQYSILSDSSFSQMKYYFNPVVEPVDTALNITLLPCPLGFTLSDRHECICNEKLPTIENVTCNITKKNIHRQGTTWIGALEQNSSNASVVFSISCPFDYCYRSSKEIKSGDHFLDGDIQCTANRTGVLCGGCRDNFSLALTLRSNRCLYGCSNNMLSLIIAFAAMGIALVFFIKILNITVSQGTTNGLIFYSNMLEVNPFLLYTNEHASGETIRVIYRFFAWVNLDLGIETCFYNGMDAYAKAWLQFLFPVYVLAIALFIIFLSHYSSRASQLFGNNSVPVLATLVLLSYSKLLRAVMSAFSSTRIHFLSGSTLTVWEIDGNIQYFTGKHIPLFVFALAVLVLLWFPLTLILVSIQWLQKGTHYRVLCWVAKLKPFFDAFTGPLKDKHCYWVGVLLLARCILLLVFFISDEESATLFSEVVIILTILTFLNFIAGGSVYKNRYLQYLELSYMLNLGIFSSGILYVRHAHSNETPEALVIVSLSTALFQSVAIVVYHACMQLRKPMQNVWASVKTCNTRRKCEDGNTNTLKSDSLLTESSSILQPTHQRQQVVKFRESLLEYMTD